ncbi:MAG TPA: cytochrome c3 family protein [Syntrophorhabdaceae bacterium]|jgi:hypothetical protein
MRRGDTSLKISERYGRLLIGLSLAFILLSTMATNVMAVPKKLATAKPGDCAACHGSEKRLPQDHKATKGMSYQACLECHEKSGPMSLTGKMPGSHMHQISGITCTKCHGKVKKPEEVKMKQCVACHNTDKIAEKTAKVKPQNPHESPHYGRTLDCNLCHHQHGKSENYCNQCHKFDYKVP